MSEKSDSLEVLKKINQIRYIRNQQSHSVLSKAKLSGDYQIDNDLWKILDEIRDDIRFSEYFSTPKWILEFITRLLSTYNNKFNKVLDPWANTGTILSILSATGLIKNATGLIRNPNQYKIAQFISSNLHISWEIADPFEWINKTDKKYDLIISNPPWGWRQPTFIKPPKLVDITDDLGNLLILLSCMRLSDNGVGIFIVPPSFIFKSKTKSVYNNLEKFGLFLNAYLEFPSGSFAPLTNIPSALIVIKKSISNTVFAGIVRTELELQDRLINNLHKRLNNKDESLGVVVDAKAFEGIQPIIIKNQIVSLGRDTHGSAYMLGKLVNEVNLVQSGKKHKDIHNSVFLPLIGKQNAVNSVSELTNKHHNYIQLIVNPENINPFYLASYFNTELGLKTRKSAESGSIISRLNKNSILHLMVYLPSVAIQNEIVETENILKSISQDIQDMQDRLWAKSSELNQIKTKIKMFHREESFDDWLIHLPFPLGSILRQYIVKKDDYKIKYEHLLHFFESTSEFLSTILLSGVWYCDPDNKETELPELITNLRKKNISLDNPSFGTWNQIHAHLSKIYRSLLNSAKEEDKSRVFSIFKCGNKQVFESITSKKIIGILETINNFRNEWLGHSGIVSINEAQQRLGVLEEYLIKTRQVFGTVWEDYHLITPISSVFQDGIHKYSVKLIHGIATPFEEKKIDSITGLEDQVLYMHSPIEKEALQLLPFLKMGDAPETSMDACYFYNRKKKDGLRFVSYHYEQVADIIDNSSSIIRLISNISQLTSNVL